MERDSKQKILVIDDNPDTRKFLEAMLSKEYEIISAENAVVGIDLARTRQPDLILLDIMMPMINGFDACSLIKKDEKTRRIPILILSAKNTTPDITQGLGIGADDYLGKPFDFKELLARIKVRIRKPEEVRSQPLQIGEIKIDPATREVKIGTKKIELTLTEFDILRCLASQVGKIVSRDDLLKEVWKDQAKKTNYRTIDVHIRALRKKIPSLTKHVISIYGVGYKFEL